MNDRHRYKVSIKLKCFIMDSLVKRKKCFQDTELWTEETAEPSEVAETSFIPKKGSNGKIRTIEAVTLTKAKLFPKLSETSHYHQEPSI